MSKITDLNPFMLHSWDDLRIRLQAAAERNERSLNSEIIARLEASFVDQENTADDTNIAQIQTRLALLEQEIEELRFEKALARQPRLRYMQEAAGWRVVLNGADIGIIKPCTIHGWRPYQPGYRAYRPLTFASTKHITCAAAVARLVRAATGYN